MGRKRWSGEANELTGTRSIAGPPGNQLVREVVVCREGGCQAEFFHDQEREAVGERPVLVRPVAVADAPRRKALVSSDDDGGVRIGLHRLQELNEDAAVRTARQEVGGFDEHVLAGHDAVMMIARQLDRPRVQAVARIRQRHVERSVRKHGRHDRGCP